MSSVRKIEQQGIKRKTQYFSLIMEKFVHEMALWTYTRNILTPALASAEMPGPLLVDESTTLRSTTVRTLQ